MLSRKYYQLIANEIKNTQYGWTARKSPVVREALHSLATNLVRKFKQDNPAFDSARFLDASGFDAPFVP